MVVHGVGQDTYQQIHLLVDSTNGANRVSNDSIGGSFRFIVDQLSEP